MSIKKQYLEEVKNIMSFEDEMLNLLPKLNDTLNTLNPWVEQLPEIFSRLNLKPGQVLLDLPCGKGGVSIPLAKKYGITILGYDIIETYIKNANSLAKKEKVNHLCKFKVEDLRRTVTRKDICDVLLWVAPPHLWKDSKETIKALRNSVKDRGIILIADAYVYKPTKKYLDYETLNTTTKGYTSLGDKLLEFIDYKDSLWKTDYARCRNSAQETLSKIKTNKDKETIRRYIQSLDNDEVLDTKYLGLGIWIIQVIK